MNFSEDWDNAPSADQPSVSPHTGTTPTPGSGEGISAPGPQVEAVDDGWGNAPVADPEAELLERGYQLLADDPDEQAIAAQRQANREARAGESPARIPLPDESLPAGPSPEVTPGVAPVTVPGLPPLPPRWGIPTSLEDAPGSDDGWGNAPVAGGAALPGLSTNAPELLEPGMGASRPAGAAIPFSVSPHTGGNEDDGFDGAPVAGEPIDIDFDPDDPENNSLPVEEGDIALPVKAKRDPKEKPAATRKKGKKGNTIGGIRLTARDMAIMAFLARYRSATVGQLARRFETSETALRNRLPALDRAGLITWAWGGQTKPKIWLITEEGLRTVNMSLTVPTVRWGQLRHTLGLVDMGIAFELGGETVLTEREIRAAATRYTPTKRIRTAIDFARTVEVLTDDEDPTVARVKQALTVPVPGRGFGHIPDMVLVRQPFPNGLSGSIAVELELTRKGLSEWKTVLTAYRDSNVFIQCYYFVMSADIKRALEGVIKALNASDKISVIQFTPVDLTADPYVTGGGGE